VTVEVSTGNGGGAGVLWAPDLVVTNAHVARAPRLRVGLADDRHLEARLVAADRRADLALLRMPRTKVALASLADSDTVCVGALVVALGHPLGLRRTLTAGVVHALGPVSPGGRRWIHADLRLAPGNSGGPLADTAGHVVGINTMITGRLALAIPINDVRRFVSAALAGNA
jgi:serine protease Do